MRALILSGGAAAGAYEAGVVYALTAQEQFDLVCGTSIGAVNAAFVAQGLREEMKALWNSIEAINITQLRPQLEVFRRIVMRVSAVRQVPVARKFGASLRVLSELRHLREAHDLIHIMSLFPWDPLLAEMEPRANLATIRCGLILGVTNLTRGCAGSFYAFPESSDSPAAAFQRAEPSATPLTPANYVPAVCASAALPPAFEPVWIEDSDGKRCAFADGGIANNTPIRQAVDAGATHITVIFLNHVALRTADRKIANMADVVFAANDVTQDRILDLDLKLLRSINERVAAGGARGKRFVDIRVIGPSVPLPLEGMQFNDQATVDRAFALGVRDGEAALRAERADVSAG